MNIGDSVKLKKSTLAEYYNNPEWLLDFNVVGGLGGKMKPRELERTIREFITTNGVGEILGFNIDRDPKVRFKKLLNGIIYEHEHYFGREAVIILKKAFEDKAKTKQPTAKAYKSLGKMR